MLISNTDPAFHHHLAVVADIKSLIAREWQVDLGHTLCEGNSFADQLAKQEPPSCFRSHLLADRLEFFVFYPLMYPNKKGITLWLSVTLCLSTI